MDLRSAAMFEERAATPLEPDTLVPAQYFDLIGAASVFQPEKRLMLAVLEEAIATFQRHIVSDTRRSQQLAADVEEWTASDDDEWPFSFRNICAALDIEPDYLRTGMARWKEAERHRARSGKSAVYRFPFRRVNGRRHSITGPREYLKKIA